jgi:ketosteroid isomerase-like protein
MKILHSAIFCIAVSTIATPSRSAALETHDKDSALIVAVVEKFHSALAASDSAAVKSLLANDVVVLESGELENRAEYLAHHMGADMEFARTVKSERKVVSVTRNGDSAWLVAKSTTVGTFKGRAINSQGAELMVLTKSGSGWKIRAIHWSSARRQP